MLGHNDTWAAPERSPLEIGLGALQLVAIVQGSAGGVATIYPAPDVLLIAPPPLPASVAEGPMGELFTADAAAKTQQLGVVYAALAQAADVAFLDAGNVTKIDGVDGVHSTADGQRELGEAIAEKVRDLLESQP